MAKIDTSKIEGYDTMTAEEKLAALEDILYGTESEEARLIMPDELATLLGDAA